jgi:phosphoglycerate dehydrogenase-like enzyme
LITGKESIMKSPTVLLHTDNPEASCMALKRTHPDIPVLTVQDYSDLIHLAQTSGATVLHSINLTRARPFPRAELLASPLKWISVAGSGTDHLAPWDVTQTTVTNSAGVAADMMAEYTLAAMLHFTLNRDIFARHKADHHWARDTLVEPIDGKTLLIVGLGRTGTATAAKAKALGLHTIGVRANPKPTPNIDEVYPTSALTALCPRADFILVCVPLLPSTRGLIGPAEFAAMKPSAVLIDISRGFVVDEAALIDALQNHKIRGAALDVFTEEPLPPTHPLWDIENLILTPHRSAVYVGWDIKTVEMFAQNLTRYCNGDPLQNIVDPVRGY